MDDNADASLDFTEVFDDNEVCSSTRLQEVHRRIIRALGEQWEKIPAEIRGAYGIRFILLNVAFSKSTLKPAANKLMRDKNLCAYTTAAARGVLSAMLWGNKRLSQIARWNALINAWPFLKQINKVDGLLPMTESPRQTETSLKHADRRTQRKRLPRRVLAAPPSQLNDVQPARKRTKLESTQRFDALENLAEICHVSERKEADSSGETGAVCRVDRKTNEWTMERPQTVATKIKQLQETALSIMKIKMLMPFNPATEDELLLQVLSIPGITPDAVEEFEVHRSILRDKLRSSKPRRELNLKQERKLQVALQTQFTAELDKLQQQATDVGTQAVERVFKYARDSFIDLNLHRPKSSADDDNVMDAADIMRTTREIMDEIQLRMTLREENEKARKAIESMIQQNEKSRKALQHALAGLTEVKNAALQQIYAGARPHVRKYVIAKNSAKRRQSGATTARGRDHRHGRRRGYRPRRD
ncbi:hypothetical protein AAL_08184 [Moelleriella libera RCEF 2490]|uniref:Uncharacterized protein n=1 Tax=Moelleriella libera RCEF 2490 TaxID=1081109 RepID=A0A162IF37_9HYPO|nr:hypothetical protein AAL_08184 [Moelleriella libera RCEF 2490]